MFFTISNNFNVGFKFPMTVHNFSEIPSNIPDRFKFILIREGSAIIELNESRIALAAPAIACLNEKNKLGFYTSESFKADVLLFNPNLLREKFSFDALHGNRKDFTDIEHTDAYFFTPFLDKQSQVVINVTNLTLNYLKNKLNTIKKELNEPVDNLWPCKSRAEFIELLCFINKIYKKDKTEVNNYTFIKEGNKIEEIILYLYENFSNKITISKLTKEFNTNRTSLANQFKKATGYNISDYLIQIRIQNASLLLRDTGLPISLIMEKSGFYNKTYFGRIFKERTGFTPTNFRERFIVN